jgi:hypothetical protein
MPHVLEAGVLMLPAVSPDGKIVCTRAKLDHIQFFDAKTARPITAPIQQAGRVLQMQFTSDSKYLCSCADNKPDDFDSAKPRPIPKTNTGDDGLRVWNPKTGEPVAGPFGTGISFRYPGSIAAYDPIDERVVTVENSEFDVDELSSRVAIHSVKHNKEAIAIIEIPAHSYQVRWIAADRLLINGRRMESVEARRSRVVYDKHPLFMASLADGKVTAVQLAKNCVGYPEIAPDNKYIATMVRHPEGVRTTCWRVGQIERLWEHPGMLVAFGDNGWLATEQRGGITQIRSLHDGRVIWQKGGVLDAKVKGKNLWLFTAKGYEVWQADWVDKKT